MTIFVIYILCHNMKILRTELIRLRKDQQLTMKQVSAFTHIDQALISKYERGARIPSEDHLIVLALTYHVPLSQLRKLWLSEKVVQLVQYYPEASEALIAAEPRVEYLSKKDALNEITLDQKIIVRLAHLDKLKKKWLKKKPKNTLQWKKMQEYFAIEYTYESNRIEGNTLTLKETEMVINQGLTVGGKSMIEHLEATNHAHAISFIKELVADKVFLNSRTLSEIHSLVLKAIDVKNAGVYRSVPVRISGSEHIPPQPYLLNKLMEDYFIHYVNHASNLHPIIMAAEMHERLVTIHPFIDGNGRTARLVMNLILLQHGYTIANLKGENKFRMAYYNALEKVQIDNDPKVFYHLIMDAAERSLEEHIELAG